MVPFPLPEPLAQLVSTLASFLDQRHAELLEPLFRGALLAHGRRTATTWFRAGDLAPEFRRGYTLLGTLGRRLCPTFAALLFDRLRRTIDPGPRWLFGLDDTPTQRYGPCVEGAGIHHNPTPGPAQQRHLYGHVWVTLAWVTRHPAWHVLALPLLAELYIRRQDLPTIPADHRPEFETKLQQAARLMRWLAEELQDSDKPIWFVVDGAYTKRPVFREARALGLVLVGRLRRDAALWSLPVVLPEGQRGQGRPPKYGKQRLSLAKRAGQARGWEEVTCFQYQKTVTRTIKTFLATYRPAGGLIRVVLVKEGDGWLAYCCTDPNASVQDILEAVAGRTALEQTFKEVKEVEGAGQQQLRYRLANVGAYHWCLWQYTAVEWWAWNQAEAELSDRSDSPWENQEEPRRVSHAEKRKALQRQCLREEFQRRCGAAGCAPEMREFAEALLQLAL